MYPLQLESVDFWSSMGREIICGWWRVHCKALPLWANLALVVFSAMPSAASCERIFSNYKTFCADRYTNLEDKIQAAMMVIYNKQANEDN
jgi:hypothetical protein